MAISSVQPFEDLLSRLSAIEASFSKYNDLTTKISVKTSEGKFRPEDLEIACTKIFETLENVNKVTKEMRGVLKEEKKGKEVAALRNRIHQIRAQYQESSVGVFGQVIKFDPSFKEKFESQFRKACKKGNRLAVGALLSVGIEINNYDQKGFSGLHYASANGHIGVVSFLVNNKATINIPALDQSTPLHVACYNGHDKVIQFLLANGAHPSVTDARGSTPLLLACSRANKETIAKLLTKNFALINQANCEGVTPMHKVAKRVDDPVIGCLILQAGGLVDTTREKDNWTPVDVAYFKGNTQLIDLIKSQQKSPASSSSSTTENDDTEN